MAANEQLPEGTDSIIEGAGTSDLGAAGGNSSGGGSAGDFGSAAVGSGTSGDGETISGGGGADTGSNAVSGSGTGAGGNHGDDASSEAKSAGGTGAGADGMSKGSWFEKIDDLRTQGFDSARSYAVSGKDRATTALDDLIGMVHDAAGQIDDKLGGDYGDYARRAADSLGGFNDALKGKDVDELFNDARALIAKAPAVTVGAAAALGFVVARLARAGLQGEPGKAPSDA